MAIKKFGKIESWEQLNDFVQDIYNNLGIDDLKGPGVRDSAPDVNSLGKGQMTVEDSDGVTKIHYRKLDGTLKSVTLS